MVDTNVVIAVVNHRPQSVAERLAVSVEAGGDIAVSAVTTFELWYGAHHSQRQQHNLGVYRKFLTGKIVVLPFDADDAVTAGEIRADLRRRGLPIGPYDVLIAAQALRRGATLVTANTAEFSRIPGLRLEDWTE